jgi:PAS domain S-box-containing protein
MTRKYAGVALKVSAIYGVIGCLWILFSDRYVALFTKDPTLITRISMVKGWLYVVSSAILIYWLIRHYIAKVRSSEEKLVSVEETFAKAFNFSPMLMTISTIDDGKYLEVNEKFCQVTGFSREEAIGRTSVQLGWISASGRERIISELRHGERVTDLEIKLTAKDGGSVFCLYSAEIITIEEKECLLSIALDITERKKNLEALDYANACFTQALTAPDHVLYRLNIKDGCYDYLSPAFEKITGYPVEEFRENDVVKLKEYFHPDDLGPVFDSMDEAFSHKTGNTVHFNLEYRFRKANGEYCWLHDYPTAIFDDNDELECFFGSAYDITEKKESEQLLRESEERFRKIIAESPISMAVVSMDGTIEYINNCAIETFGYLPEEIPHMNDWWLKAYPEARYRDKVIKQWMGLIEKAIAENRYIERREYRTTCKDGTDKTMLIFGVLVLGKVFVMFEDITQRKVAEEEIQRLNRDLEKIVGKRTEELQRINRDLSSFCYAISHELHAPVRRLKGLSKALQEEWEENPSDAEYCVKRIEIASGELERVINSVLHLSRLSQFPFTPILLDLSGVVREICDSLIGEAPERQVEVIIADDIGAFGDASLVRLCLENLVGNAFKYTALQPVARIEFGRESSNNAFFVKDNGIGFDMTNADNLFEPFIRLHDEDEYGGSGIGLATVQRIIERHGGKIWADSAPGNGTTFYFTLTHHNGDRHDA